MKNIKRFLPLAGFVVVILLLALPLLRGENLTVVQNALIGKAVPAFRFQDFSKADLIGHVSVVNVFASWCVPCREEQAMLQTMAQENKSVIFYGIAYKDSKAAVKVFLKRGGDPFRAIGFDPAGRAAIDWGVSGVPETFIIDRAGIIRYHLSGAITQQEYKTAIKPLFLELTQ